MIKLIAIDMDGTLLSSDRTISQKNKSVIAKALTLPEVSIVLCTGRPATGILPYLEELQLTDKDEYVISQNGAYIFQSKTKQVLAEKVLDTTKLSEIVELAQKHHIGLMGVGEAACYSIAMVPTDMMVLEARIVDAPLIELSLEEALQTKFHKLLFIETPETLDAFEQILPQTWRENFYIVRSQGNLLEMMNQGINKAEALKELGDYLSIPLSSMMAIGDGMNDIEMIKEVGYGVAMENAVPALKAIAQAQTSSNDNDGVANAIVDWLQLEKE
ncbi:Cof-type HAD-IIB family hydrolase [Granulicatella seriolae]|uniref:Cof-type HAD-IIB family hydrolase n=1 Tax=Granulicatella seriolae TaxID=2967226 RepID=A0ABT1WJZ7_9LACT|nr:Cof-type HAD-IIB family hydrolase [Granulicatella seriolae]